VCRPSITRRVREIVELSAGTAGKLEPWPFAVFLVAYRFHAIRILYQPVMPPVNLRARREDRWFDFTVAISATGC